MDRSTRSVTLACNHRIEERAFGVRSLLNGVTHCVTHVFVNHPYSLSDACLCHPAISVTCCRSLSMMHHYCVIYQHPIIFSPLYLQKPFLKKPPNKSSIPTFPLDTRLPQASRSTQPPKTLPTLNRPNLSPSNFIIQIALTTVMDIDISVIGYLAAAVASTALLLGILRCIYLCWEDRRDRKSSARKGGAAGGNV